MNDSLHQEAQNALPEALPSWDGAKAASNCQDIWAIQGKTHLEMEPAP